MPIIPLLTTGTFELNQNPFIFTKTSFNDTRMTFNLAFEKHWNIGVGNHIAYECDFVEKKILNNLRFLGILLYKLGCVSLSMENGSQHRLLIETRNKLMVYWEFLGGRKEAIEPINEFQK